MFRISVFEFLLFEKAILFTIATKFGQCRPAIFLDRDGVINENRIDYVKSWDEFVFMPGALNALCLLAKSEYAIIVVSNQSAVGRGLVEIETVESIHKRMQDTIGLHNGRIDAIYYCPHTPHAGCDCRKPSPGLLQRAAYELNLDLLSSWLIGDAFSDIEAGFAVGCSSILVLTGRGQEQYPLLRQRRFKHVPVVANLPQAVALILKEDLVVATGSYTMSVK